VQADTGGQPDLVVIGGSAGGVEALKRFIGGLPPDLPATVCLTLHLADGAPSLLPAILARAGAIEVLPAVDGAPLRPGVAYVSQPGAHLAVVDDHVVPARAPRRTATARPSTSCSGRPPSLAGDG